MRIVPPGKLQHLTTLRPCRLAALFAQASEQIKVEIIHGNYVEVKTVPLVISPLGVIEKPGALELYMIAVVLLACLLTITPLSWINKGFSQWIVLQN